MDRHLNGKSIFLLDGVGAVISALSLGLLLPAVQPWIGMPLWVLRLLAVLAVMFATYSLSCYRFADHSNPLFLKVVIAANLSYCVLSLYFVMTYFSALKLLGLIYFIAEKAIVLGIVFLEFRVLAQLTK